MDAGLSEMATIGAMHYSQEEFLTYRVFLSEHETLLKWGLIIQRSSITKGCSGTGLRFLETFWTITFPWHYSETQQERSLGYRSRNSLFMFNETQFLSMYLSFN